MSQRWVHTCLSVCRTLVFYILKSFIYLSYQFHIQILLPLINRLDLSYWMKFTCWELIVGPSLRYMIELWWHTTDSASCLLYFWVELIFALCFNPKIGLVRDKTINELCDLYNVYLWESWFFITRNIQAAFLGLDKRIRKEKTMNWRRLASDMNFFLLNVIFWW